jgi:hypothetical protein
MQDINYRVECSCGASKIESLYSLKISELVDALSGRGTLSTTCPSCMRVIDYGFSYDTVGYGTRVVDPRFIREF